MKLRVVHFICLAALSSPCFAEPLQGEQAPSFDHAIDAASRAVKELRLEREERPAIVTSGEIESLQDRVQELRSPTRLSKQERDDLATAISADARALSEVRNIADLNAARRQVMEAQTNFGANARAVTHAGAVAVPEGTDLGAACSGGYVTVSVFTLMGTSRVGGYEITAVRGSGQQYPFDGLTKTQTPTAWRCLVAGEYEFRMRRGNHRAAREREVGDAAATFETLELPVQ